MCAYCMPVVYFPHPLGMIVRGVSAMPGGVAGQAVGGERAELSRLRIDEGGIEISPV